MKQTNLKNIDLNNYILIKPTDIKKIDNEIELYDIEVEDTNNFFIRTDYGDLLLHNCDGNHIAGLLINFFYKWFPKIILNEKLFKLEVPLLSFEESQKRKYIYNLNDFKKDENYKNIRYLKGLGSLDLKDWELIFKNMNLSKILNDGTSEQFLGIAFGNEAKLRKKWLSKK